MESDEGGALGPDDRPGVRTPQRTPETTQRQQPGETTFSN